MGLSLQPVTFFPIPPVRPVARNDDQETPATRASTPPAQTTSAPRAPQGAGRLLDIKV
jgi:hypothetical protein